MVSIFTAPIAILILIGSITTVLSVGHVQDALGSEGEEGSGGGEEGSGGGEEGSGDDDNGNENNGGPDPDPCIEDPNAVECEPIDPCIEDPNAVECEPPGSECDPSYPDNCIPSPPPSLNCDDIPSKNFNRSL